MRPAILVQYLKYGMNERSCARSAEADVGTMGCDGLEMYYEVHKGLVPRDTLFIHGNLASSRWWHPSLELWKKASPEADRPGSLIFADWRGCGRSSAPRDRSEMRMENLAGDFVKLLERLGCEDADVVGHSTGGIIAMLAMAQAPERFRRAVLLDSVGAKGVTFGPEIPAAFKAMAGDKALTAQVIGATIHGLDPEDAFFKDVVVEDAFRAVKALGTWVIESLQGIDHQEDIRRIRQETLVLHGEHDVLLPKADSEELAELLPRGEFRELKGRGHCANAEAPADFVRVVEGFLYR